MIKAIEDTYPSFLEEASKMGARVKLQGNDPNYEVFYSVKQHVQFVPKSAAQAQLLSKDQLTHITVTAIRLSTLIRGVGLAQTASALFHFDNKYYLRNVDKNSKKKTQVIAGATLRLVTA